MLRRLLTVLGLAAFIGMSGLGASAQSYGPRYAPPPPRYERHGPPPHSGYVWVGGYHHWDGNKYVWIAGGWQRPPRYGAVWIPGRYVNRGGYYVWIPGHWS